MFTQAAPGKVPAMQELPPSLPAASSPGPDRQDNITPVTRATRSDPSSTANCCSCFPYRRKTRVTIVRKQIFTDKAPCLLTGGEEKRKEKKRSN